MAAAFGAGLARRFMTAGLRQTTTTLFPVLAPALGTAFKVAVMAKLLADAGGIGGALANLRITLDIARALARVTISVALLIAVEYTLVHPAKAEIDRWRRAAQPWGAAMAALTLDGIGHACLGRTILDDIDLSVAPGEIVALVGLGLRRVHARPCRCRADQPAHGPRRARLCPPCHDLPGPCASALGERIAQAAAGVAPEPDDQKKLPADLSGGMRHRAAIARAMAAEPDFILFDEPFTARDVALRRRLPDLVMAACAAGHVSDHFITHDLSGTARLAHRIAVLDTRRRGILGERILDGARTKRSDEAVLGWVQGALLQGPLFRHIHDVDERRIA